MQIGFERGWMAVTDQFTNGWFGHACLDELGDAGMPQQMGVESV
jgi:hypothetical protein